MESAARMMVRARRSRNADVETMAQQTRQNAMRWLWRGLLVPLVALCVMAPQAVTSTAAAAKVAVTIDLSQQRMYVAVGGRPSYTWVVSTARPGYRTPTGTFRPIRLERVLVLDDLPPFADALFDLLLGGLCHPRHLRDPVSRPSGIPRLRPADAEPRADSVQPRQQIRPVEHPHYRPSVRPPPHRRNLNAATA